MPGRLRVRLLASLVLLFSPDAFYIWATFISILYCFYSVCCPKSWLIWMACKSNQSVSKLSTPLRLIFTPNTYVQPATFQTICSNKALRERFMKITLFYRSGKSLLLTQEYAVYTQELEFTPQNLPIFSELPLSVKNTFTTPSILQLFLSDTVSSQCIHLWLSLICK